MYLNDQNIYQYYSNLSVRLLHGFEKHSSIHLAILSNIPPVFNSSYFVF